MVDLRTSDLDQPLLLFGQLRHVVFLFLSMEINEMPKINIRKVGSICACIQLDRLTFVLTMDLSS